MAVSRRQFLLGSGGAALALPVLGSLASRGAAQADQIRRFVLMLHQGGLVRTKWMPGTTGALPGAGNISELLAPLNGIRDQLVVLSGLGNPARHIVPGDNHRRTNTTVLTNVAPQDDVLAGGPSIDQLAAQLIGTGTQRASLLLPLSRTWDGPNYFFSQSSGGLVNAVTPFSSNPREAAMALFASLPSEGTPPPTPSYADRLRQRRSTLLGAATGNLRSLRARVSESDRSRLDAHEEHLTRLSSRFAAPPPTPTIGCVAPEYATIANRPDREDLGRYDNETAPAQIDNLVRAFSCDISRVGVLYFNNGQSPTFPWLYGGDTSAAWRGQDGRQFTDWHDLIHNGQPTGADSDSGVPNLVRGHLWYAEQFARLVQSLATTPEIDGNGMMVGQHARPVDERLRYREPRHAQYSSNPGRARLTIP